MKYFTLLIMALTSLATPGWFSRLRSRLPRWNVLTNSQKVALVSFISLTLMLPIITLATLEGTRLASRAVEPVTPPITPPNTPTPTLSPTLFYLYPYPSGNITMPVSLPNTGYGIYALLKDQNGRVVINQQDFSYQWSIDDPTVANITPFSGCTNGIQPPCPLDHLSIRALRPTTPNWTYIRAQVTQLSTSKLVATISFNLTVTPAATPTPARSIQVKLPNGGETLYVGQTYRISWDSSSNIDKVWLGYTTGPGSLNWIATNIPNTGFYDWKVFVGNTTNTKFKIDITGYQTGYGSAHDQSDDFFTVLSSPSPTLTPTPTPSLTPTPTPPPTPNLAPRIQTWFLPPGRINRNYRANVVGTDRNQNDKLTLTTQGLPPGINQEPCSTTIQGRNARISCGLSGRPTATGVYPVRVILADNRGGRTETTLLLVVHNLFRWR